MFKNRCSRIYGVIAIKRLSSPGIFVLMIVAAHLLNSGYNWTQYTLSHLALLRYGWLETAAVCIFGLFILSLAPGLYSAIQPRIGLRSAVIILIVMGLAFLMVAAFKTSDSDVVTMSVLIHRGATVIIAVTFPLASFLMLPSLRLDPRWRGLAVYCATAGIISVVLDIIAISMPHEIQTIMAGLWERISAANGIVWFQVFAVRLFNIHRATQ